VAAFEPVGWIYLGGCAGIALLLLLEHALVRPDDLGRVNQAFFTVNALVALTVMISSTADILSR